MEVILAPCVDGKLSISILSMGMAALSARDSDVFSLQILA